MVSAFLTVYGCGSVAPQVNVENCRRRKFLATTGLATASVILGSSAEGEALVKSSSPSHGTSRDLARRLTDSNLQEWETTAYSSPVVYPAWMAGVWQVSATLVRVRMPLGERFLSSGQALQEREGRSCSFSMRYAINPATGSGQVEEDVPFNVAQRLVAEAGWTDGGAIQRIEFDPRKKQDGEINIVLMGNPGPRISVFRRNQFAQTLHDENFCVDQVVRQVFFNLGEGSAPVVSDSEAITQFRKMSQDRIQARQRVATYLVPGAPLFDDANGHAVLFQDYDMTMKLVERE
mmetsp:Transcript_9531/g.19500  ORF Transcript_9531/g.19500 Transcript_9531/m.19500 type:complete len:291 (+) Transcript_9531:1994-2866(+)